MPSTSSSRSHTVASPGPMADPLLNKVVPALDTGYAAATGSGMADAMSGYVKRTLDPSFTDVSNDPVLQRLKTVTAGNTMRDLNAQYAASGRGAPGTDLQRYSQESLDRATAGLDYDALNKRLALQQGAAGLAPAAQGAYQSPSLAYAGGMTGVASQFKDQTTNSSSTSSNPMGMALTLARLAMGDPTAMLGMGQFFNSGSDEHGSGDVPWA
jgi:hypothetical protein